MSGAAEAPLVLRLEGVTKRFGPVLANDSIDLALRRGEILALLGENGAGKTTLMSIIFGHYAADSGRVEVMGRRLAGGPGEALAAGLGMVHQHFALAGSLTVLENVVLGTRPLLSPRLRLRPARVRLAQLAREYGLSVDPDARVSSLSVGERQRVEILKALWRGARVLILDEPTAVLTPQESESLFAMLRRAARKGLSAIFISHKLNEVLAVSDRVVVLRHGRLVGQMPTAAATRSALARLMVGTEVVAPEVPEVAAGAVRLALRRVSVAGEGSRPGLREVDLELRAGRITGLAGVSGNGQAALAALLSGLRTPEAGEMWIDGRRTDGWSPREALRHGVARVPEDRHAVGAIGRMTIAENAGLEDYWSRFARYGLLDRRAMRDHADAIIRATDLRGGGPETRAGLLSGGNLQKLILGRALAREAGIVLADQPTRGLDVGAVAEVQRRLLAARERGAAVLLISEDLEELMALSDVIHVISRGRLSPPVPRGEAEVEVLGLMMAGEGFGRHAA